MKEREEAVLEVEITSKIADVSWRKDGSSITRITEKIEFVKEETIRKLVIKNTTVHDEGEYVCVLEDEECSAELIVIGK